MDILKKDIKVIKPINSERKTTKIVTACNSNITLSELYITDS
jgi:hypothetical protein